MKIIFAGTPAFAAIALQFLIDSPHEILAVYTQPDKPSGRGLKLSSSPVKQLALAHDLPLHQPVSLKTEAEQAVLKHFNADVMVVAAYGLLLPKAVLAIPERGCINIHPSLLPRWRGAAPIQRTLFAGDKETGVTIMQMDEGLDTGPILLQWPCSIEPEETSQTLHDKLAALGSKALLAALNELEHQGIQPLAQDDQFATYASKITKEEALIDWTKPALELEHLIRAFNPWPVAYLLFHDQHLRVWMAKAINDAPSQSPGTLVNASSAGIDIATGKGNLRLLQVQLPGGKMISAADFYNARRNELQIGKHL